MYHYAGNNPVRYVDPDGREDNAPIADLTLLRKLGEEMYHKGSINGVNLFLQNYEDGCFARATVIAGELEKLGFNVTDYSYVDSPVKPGVVKSEKAAGRNPANIPNNDSRRFSFHVAATVEIDGKKYTVDPFYHKSWLSISEQEDWNLCQYPSSSSTQRAHNSKGNLIGPTAMMSWLKSSNYEGSLPVNEYAYGWLQNYNTKKTASGGIVTSKCYIWSGK